MTLAITVRATRCGSVGLGRSLRDRPFEPGEGTPDGEGAPTPA